MINGTLSTRPDKWTETDLRLLLSLYYLLPFSAGDDASVINDELSVLLNRSRSSIDRQWRNVDDLVRREGSGNISKSLKSLVEETRNDPLKAIRNGIPLFGGNRRIISESAKEITDLVLNVIPTTTRALDLLSPDSFLVLLRIIWISPGFALSEAPYFKDSRAEIASALRLSLDDSLDLFKSVYCLRCRCLSSPDQLLGNAYSRFHDCLSLTPAETREMVISSCNRNRWYVWMYLKI